MTESVNLGEAVFLEYHEKVRRYISGKVTNPHDAEDLTSEVFLKICEKLEAYNAEKASISTWVYTIARNTVIDYFRTNKAHAEIPETLSSDESIDGNLLREEALSELCDALEKLDERQRDIVILRYYNGLTLKEVAEKTGISYSYAKLLHNNALSELKALLS